MDSELIIMKIVIYSKVPYIVIYSVHYVLVMERLDVYDYLAAC